MTLPLYLLTHGQRWWPALLPGHRLGWGDGYLWGSVEMGRRVVYLQTLNRETTLRQEAHQRSLLILGSRFPGRALLCFEHHL